MMPQNGDRRAVLATWFIGVSALGLVAGTVFAGLTRDTVPASLAAMTGTVLGYLAGLLAPQPK